MGIPSTTSNTPTDIYIIILNSRVVVYKNLSKGQARGNVYSPRGDAGMGGWVFGKPIFFVATC
jgi:hypothetical protein